MVITDAAAGPALHVEVLSAARLRCTAVRDDRDEPRPPDGLYRARLLRPRRVLRARRLRERGPAGARDRVAVGVSAPRGAGRRALRARVHLHRLWVVQWILRA